MNPTITEMPKVVVVVGNDLIRQEMEQIHGSIVNTLKRDLHNSSIVLDIVVDEHHDEVKILTRREQFTEMVKANSAVEKLRTVFDLELA
jgi:DNA polymerase-3 subunit gamma/tau